MVLVGMDVLSGTKDQPADVLLSKGIIVLDNVEIPCKQVRYDRVRKVRAADFYTIPGYTECVFDVFVERTESDDHKEACEVFIEPTSHFKENYPLVMANSIADLNISPTVKIRVLNPNKTEYKIRQDSIIASAEDI